LKAIHKFFVAAFVGAVILSIGIFSIVDINSGDDEELYNAVVETAEYELYFGQTVHTTDEFYQISGYNFTGQIIDINGEVVTVYNDTLMERKTFSKYWIEEFYEYKIMQLSD